MADRNIILVGFMGTGKSTIAKKLAKRLQWEVVDLDTEIERAAGCDIPTIFQDQGEPAFRKLEQDALAACSGREHLVVSCGGGIVTVPGNLERLEAAGTLICLTASPWVIWQRVRHSSNRPLISGPDGEIAMRRLFAERKPLYDAIRIQIDTDNETPAKIASRILAQISPSESTQDLPESG